MTTASAMPVRPRLGPRAAASNSGPSSANATRWCSPSPCRSCCSCCSARSSTASTTGSTVTSAQYLVPSMIAAGIASTDLRQPRHRASPPTARTARSSGCAARRCRRRRTSSARSSSSLVVDRRRGGADAGDRRAPVRPAAAHGRRAGGSRSAGCSLLGTVALLAAGHRRQPLAAMSASQRGRGDEPAAPWCCAFLSGIYFTPITALPERAGHDRRRSSRSSGWDRASGRCSCPTRS